MLRHLAGIAVLTFAGAAAAQDAITPDEFLDAAVGHTLTFRPFEGDGIVGQEEFLRRDLTVWTDPRGRCTYGRIELRGPRICFIYDDDPDDDNCWLPFRYKGQFVVMAGTGEMQRVTRITKLPLDCDGAPLS